VKVAIASDWFPPRRGGIEAQLFGLAQGLGSRGHHVDVLTSTPGAVDGPAFRVRSLGVTTLPGLQLTLSPWLFAALRRQLGAGYDVVHAHVSVVSPVGYAAAIVARSLGMPTVLTFHSVLRQKAFLLAAIDVMGTLRESDVTWGAVSELVAAQVGRALRDTAVAVLPNGIDIAFWRQAAPAQPGHSRSRIPTLVSAMRLHRKKRPRQLLQAFAQAARSRGGMTARLLIVGDGPERGALERDIRDRGLHEGSATAELIPWQDAHALRLLYAEAHCFVLPSARESFGIAALEARAAGLPVIAMKGSGSSEFLCDGENALLCDDDNDLAEAMGRVVRDFQLRARLAASPASLERYDWRHVLDRHEHVYERAMKPAADRA